MRRTEEAEAQQSENKGQQEQVEKKAVDERTPLQIQVLGIPLLLFLMQCEKSSSNEVDSSITGHHSQAVASVSPVASSSLCILSISFFRTNF